MPLKLMIDSGAFTVWSKGLSIDLDEYIRFCRKRPNLSVIVNLDVIPPKGVKKTEELKDSTCKEGWANYLKMIRVLPMEKVVPVFHRGENWKWLEKFLDFGCPYVGLAPRFDGTAMTRRITFINEAKKYIYDSAGKPIVKVHGFGITNHTMMTDFKWYSVDSASHTQLASWGSILVPKLKGNEWDFRAQPYRVFCSVIANKRHSAEHHLLAMKEQRPALFAIVKRWLDEHKIGLGEDETIPANGRKPIKLVERWADRAETKILKIKVPGVTNYDQTRRFLNVAFFHRCNDALDITDLYLAGNGPCTQIGDQIRYRLLSYVEPRALDWAYPNIGHYRTPLEYPFNETLNFSFKR